MGLFALNSWFLKLEFQAVGVLSPRDVIRGRRLRKSVMKCHYGCAIKSRRRMLPHPRLSLQSSWMNVRWAGSFRESLKNVFCSVSLNYVKLSYCQLYAIVDGVVRRPQFILWVSWSLAGFSYKAATNCVSSFSQSLRFASRSSLSLARRQKVSR